MKIIVTGSLGNISKPLAATLIAQGHSVTVISSNAERQQDIEALGATAAIGKLEDVDFLTAAFAGADAAYCMEPPTGFFDHAFDLMTHIDLVVRNYATAIKQSGIKHVVHLSSIGAHMSKGNGILAFHYHAEKILEQLPADVSLVVLRPVGFYYNLLSFIPTIKTQGAIITNYGGDDKEPWVSPVDIAAVAAEEITTPFKGRKIRYVASDELSPNEVAGILGTAIGRPGLQWVAIGDEQMTGIMKGAGMNPRIAEGLVEMNASRRGGVLYEDYFRNRPVLGNVKLTDFAKNFAAAFNKE
jgi:uncharacterized protein YbjT (DUF2867 family)